MLWKIERKGERENYITLGVEWWQHGGLYHGGRQLSITRIILSLHFFTSPHCIGCYAIGGIILPNYSIPIVSYICI